MAAFIVLQTSLRLLYPLADYAALYADDAAFSLIYADEAAFLIYICCTSFNTLQLLVRCCFISGLLFSRIARPQ